jgi:hypothetical protein
MLTETACLQPHANISAVPITDTTPEAAARQLAILRSMSGEQRMTLAYEMSMFVRELMREGIQRDYPDWTEAQVKRELLRRAFFPAPLPAWLR